MRMRQVEPRLPIIALTDGTSLQIGRPGASPWLGGLDIDDFDGSPVAAARSFGADAIDGLITDYPDRLRAVLAQRGYRPPRPLLGR